jgi:CBS domain-containing protein
MVSRPLWCQPVAGFRESLRGWVHGEGREGPMNLAIFLDAAPVAGDAALLDELRAYLWRLLSGSDAFYARFAAAIEQFGAEGGWWRRLPGLRGPEAAEVDLKKLGIFPLVHGVRTLALQYRIEALGTAERLRALAAAGRLDEALARDLVDALHCLMGVKLANNLRQIDAGRTPDNALRLAEFGTLDREALKDSLAIVRRFRQWLGTHYRLDSL